MMRAAAQIFLVNAYWFSFVLIGHLAVGVIGRFDSPKSIRETAEYIQKSHVIIRLFLTFTVAAFVLAIASLLSYIFHAPVAYMAIFYFALLLTSIIYFINLPRKIIQGAKVVRIALGKQDWQTKLALAILVLFITQDYLLSLYTRSNTGGDAIVHLSRMVTILDQGFTSRTGFFGNLPEAGYHFNFIYAFYVVPAYLVRISPDVIWEYSSAFFRLLQWAAIFTLAKHTFEYWIRDKSKALFSSYVTTSFAVVFFSSVFYASVYPNKIVSIWIILLIICFSYFEANIQKVSYLAFVASFLITSTHPTYALMAAMFTALTLFFSLLLDRRDGLRVKKSALFYVTNIVLLMIGPIRTLLYPSKLNNNQAHLGDFPVNEVLGMTFKKPILPDFLSAQAIFLVLSTIGFLYLLYKLWHTKRQLKILIALIGFYPALVYTPFLFTPLNSILPMWVIERFAAMNVLVYVSISLGIYALIEKARSIKKVKSSKPLALVLSGGQSTLLFLVVITATCLYMYKNSQAELHFRGRGNRKSYAERKLLHNNFSSSLKDDMVILANPKTSFLLPSLFAVDVIAVPEPSSPMAAETTNRLDCQAHVLETLEPQDLSELQIAYLVFSKDDPNYREQLALAKTKPFLTLYNDNTRLTTYRFDRNYQTDVKQHSVYQACETFQEAEND